jgi:hypothetical protein
MAEPEKVLWSFSRGHVGKNKRIQTSSPYKIFQQLKLYTFEVHGTHHFHWVIIIQKVKETFYTYLFWVPIVWNIQIRTVRPNK